MSYFLSSQNLILQRPAGVSDTEALHIMLSRRMKVGDKIALQGPDGKRFWCSIILLQKKNLTVVPQQEIKPPEELLVSIRLYQAMLAEKALDFVLQKATELGAASVTLFNSEHSPAHMEKSVFEKKRGRWTKIMLEAAKQSDRARVPELEFFSDIGGVISAGSVLGPCVVLDASGGRLERVRKGPIGLCVGPEGGFAPAELEKLRNAPGWSCASLGPFTLRAETAAVAAIAILAAG